MTEGTAISKQLETAATSRAWLKLDSAGIIYPATFSKTQNHQYRWEATLRDDVDKAVLESALALTMPRFPSIAVTLHRGLFWYFFEPTTRVPPIEEDKEHPLTNRAFKDVQKCGFRVLVKGRVLALEFFHALADGSGSIVFFKTLLAEYVRLKYGAAIPCTEGVLDVNDVPTAEEMRDSFVDYAGPTAKRQADVKAYQLEGTQNPDGYLTYTVLSFQLSEVLRCAKRHEVTLTGFMCAAMLLAISRVQRAAHPNETQKPVAVTLPVNLRRMFPSGTLRNFSLCVTPNIDPNAGEWTFIDVCRRVHYQMGEKLTPKEMAACIAANVNAARSMAVRLMPLPVKNLVMKAVYQILGNDNCCLSLSNMGEIRLPEAMYEYIDDVRCLMDAHEKAPYSCAVLSFKGTLRVLLNSCLADAALEWEFENVMKELGLTASVESNGGARG